MNENLNLVEILKDCPKGTKLYSPLYGEVEFQMIVTDSVRFPIRVKVKTVTSEGESIEVFTSSGRWSDSFNGECLLFPSKWVRDWGMFKYEKKELVPPCKFKVGDTIVYSLRKNVRALSSKDIISEITDNKYIFTDGSYIFINEQDSWELVTNKKPKFDPKTLQPFDKVLVRDKSKEQWKCTLYSHKKEDVQAAYEYVTIDYAYKYCIPYNDDTKHLVGTTNEAPEYYRYWED